MQPLKPANTSTLQNHDEEAGEVDLANLRFKYSLGTCQKNQRTKQPRKGFFFGFVSKPQPSNSFTTNLYEFTSRDKALTDSRSIVPENHPLNKSLKKYRIEKLITIFTEKLTRNIALKKLDSFSEQTHGSNLLERIFGEREGINMNSLWIVGMEAIGFLVVMWMTVVYSLVLIFNQVEQTTIFQVTQFIALIYFFYEVAINFFVKTIVQGKVISQVSHIARYYLRNRFLANLSFLLLFIIDFGLKNIQPMKYLRMAIIVQFAFQLSKTSKVHALICTSFKRQQQWSLAMIFFTNFIFAHFLSVFLNSMVLFNDQNWITKHDLIGEYWYVKYIYGYYWGINIMLTVGFGDFCATNWQQALCLVFIEVISCFLFSYNINCVGNLINNLRLQQVEKQKNLRTFRKMCRESKDTNRDNGDLQNRINHFIEKNFDIMNHFDLKHEEQTIALLPEKLGSEFLKKINIRFLDHLQFFKELHKKTIEQISTRISKMIVLPQQILIRRGEHAKLLILSKGAIAYTSSEQRRSKKEYVMVQKIVAKGKSKLMAFNSFIKQMAHKFDIMSTEYSVIYSLNQETFQEVIRQNRTDYEKYCQLRDSNMESIRDDPICNLCPRHLKYHTKFECPRMHYSPLKEMVCLRYQTSLKYQPRRSAKRHRERQTSLNINEWQFITNTHKYAHQGSIITQTFSQQIHQQIQPISVIGDERQIQSVLDRQCNWKFYFPMWNINNCLKRMKKGKLDLAVRGGGQ